MNYPTVGAGLRPRTPGDRRSPWHRRRPAVRAPARSEETPEIVAVRTVATLLLGGFVVRLFRFFVSSGQWLCRHLVDVDLPNVPRWSRLPPVSAGRLRPGQE